MGWHGVLLSIDACPRSSTTQYFQFSRAFLEARVHRLAHGLFTPASKYNSGFHLQLKGSDSTSSSSPPGSSANYCRSQQREWEEISFCTFSDLFLLLLCCLPCYQRKEASGSCEDEGDLTPCGSLLWVVIGCPRTSS